LVYIASDQKINIGMSKLKILFFVIMAGIATVFTSCEKDYVTEINELENSFVDDFQKPGEQTDAPVLLHSKHGKNYGISFNEKVSPGDMPACIAELINQSYPNVVIEDVEAYLEDLTNISFFEIEVEDINAEGFEIYFMHSPEECLELIEQGVEFISENCLITTGCGDEYVVGENFDLSIETLDGETTYKISYNDGEEIVFNCEIAGFDVECEDADYFEDVTDFELPELPDFELPELPDFDLTDLLGFELPTSVIVTACGDSLSLAPGDLFDLDYDGNNFVFSLTHLNGEISEAICEFGEYDVEVDKPDFGFDLDSLDFGGLDLDGLGDLDFDGLGDLGFGGLNFLDLGELGGIDEDEENILNEVEEIVNGENCIFTTPCGDEIVFDNSTDFDFLYKDGAFNYILTDENGVVTTFVCDKAGYDVDCN